MPLTFPHKVRWTKSISSDPLESYSKTTRKRLLATDNLAVRDAIEYEIVALNATLFEWFLPFYEESVSRKKSPILFDVKQNTKNTPEKVYSMLVITENGVRVGGLIFAELKQQINIAYKVYKHGWHNSKAPVNPSLYADYLLVQHTIKNGKNKISHGKDRNCFGKYSSIGLASHKLSLGYLPVLPEEYTLITTNTDKISEEQLIFSFADDVISTHLFFNTHSTTDFSQFEKFESVIGLSKHTIPLP